MEQISQVITVEGNMAGLQHGDEIDDNESESSIESLEDDGAVFHKLDSSQPVCDDGEEEFEFFGDNTSASTKNKTSTNQKLGFTDSKVSEKKLASLESQSSSHAPSLSNSGSIDMSTPEKAMGRNTFVHTVEVRLLNTDQTTVPTPTVTAVSSVDEDDEFALSEPQELDVNKDAIKKALMSAAKRQSANEGGTLSLHSRNVDESTEEEGGENIQVSIPVDIAISATARQVLSPESVTLNDLFLPPTPVYSSTYTPGSASIARSQAAKAGQVRDPSHSNKGYLEEAKKAYEDIVTGVYGSGLGDQDVLLLDATTDGRSYTSPNPTIRPGQGAAHSSVFKVSKLSTKETILEGDEEEEVEKEEELQQATTAGASAVDPDLDRLGVEWDNLPTKNDAGDFFSPVHPSSSSVASPQPTSHMKAAAALAKMPPSYFTTEMPNSHTVLYNTAFQLLCTFDLAQHRPLICVKEDSSSYSSSWLGSFSSGNKSLSFINSEQHLEVPFLLAQVDVDLARAEDLLMLQSLFVFFLNDSLSGSDLAPPLRLEVLELIQAVPAMGPHWEKIGFQGLDPRTDLNRAMKMLSVLQMLHLIEMDPVLARKLFILSDDNSLLPSAGNSKLKAQDRSWPLMCVGISFTKEAIVALRSGALNAEANKIRAIMPVLHCFHHACFYEFARLLEKSPNIHHAMHLNEIRKTCSSSPLKFYQNYSKKPADRPVSAIQTRTPSDPAPGLVAEEEDEDEDGKEIVFDNLESIVEAPPDDAGGGSNKKSGGGILKSIFGSNKKSAKFEVK